MTGLLAQERQGEWSWELAREILPDLAEGMWTTFRLTLFGIAIAVVGGLVLALLRRSRWKVISWPTACVIEFIRSTPLLVQVFFVFFVLPEFDIVLEPWTAAIGTLGVHYATYMSDGRVPEDGGPADADAAGEPIVRMQKVVKRFGDNVVLDELELDVAPAEKLVIIGPSGSGKTTILRVIMTLERPQDGHVIIDGQHLYHEERNGGLRPARERHIRAVRSEVSMVFQHFNLFPHKTVGENITLAPRKVLGLDKDEARERARELLDQVGLADKVDQHPAELSGGQKQRVAIARALAMRPKIMLFGEVTSALDPELVGDVLSVLRDLAEHSEMTMLLVTHEMGFAQEIADRVVMFDSGRIVEEAPPSRMFGDPQHERTKSFLHAVLHPGD